MTKQEKVAAKQELFKKYHINEGHKVWQPEVDNWFSVEVYRQMHGGELPPPDDMSITYVLDFIDKCADPKYFFSLDNNGSLYTTAHRMVYRHADQILDQLRHLKQEGKTNE